jgi:hypothetical protein
VAQAVKHLLCKCLLCKCEVLSSNLSPISPPQISSKYCNSVVVISENDTSVYLNIYNTMQIMLLGFIPVKNHLCQN